MSKDEKELTPQVSQWLKNLSDNLGYLRRQRHLKQKEIAELLKVRRSFVSMIETGLRAPSLLTYLRGIELFERDPGELFVRTLAEGSSFQLYPLHLPEQPPLFAYDTYLDRAQWLDSPASQLEVKVHTPPDRDYPHTLTLPPPQSIDFAFTQLGLELTALEQLKGKPVTAYYQISPPEKEKLIAIRWRSGI
ncbi:helix-turn-helix transcriptional regulator [Candidatus Woesearchaeota archaeon]|nr:helix-turn-helix transcriptional regulator [Candidatus Woesearchaeota archaeon]